MAFTPSTVVYLCDVPLENDLKNQLTFASVSAQTSYFESKTIKSYTNFTYQRKDNIIRVPDHIDNLYNCNYVRYQNSNFSNKWFYAFIVRKSYVNDHCTHLQISTDPFQTYMFDITYYKSFVAREHVADDTIFLHTLPEPVTVTGEAEAEYNNTIHDPAMWHNKTALSGYNSTTFDHNYYACIFMTEKIGVGAPTGFDDFMGGNVNMLYVYAPESINDLDQWVDHLVSNNRLGAIVGVVAIPKVYVSATLERTAWDVPFYTISDDSASSVLIQCTANLSTLDGYAPKNNKLFCYPYNYCEVVSSDGKNSVFKFEELSGASNVFEFQGLFNLGISPTFTVYPYHYAKKGKAAEHGTVYAGFQPIAFKYDAYDAWYAANENSIKFQKFQMGAQAVSSLVSLAGAATAPEFTGAAEMGEKQAGDLSGAVSGVISSATQILGYMASNADRQARPAQIKGALSMSNAIYSGTAGICIYQMRYRAEVLKMVDDYLSMYGYNVSTCKVPQFSSRTNWNYIETRDIHISGDIPEEDLAKLRRMFNTGVTMWHNPLTYGDYSQSNAIV